jgi:hypothetical protein
LRYSQTQPKTKKQQEPTFIFPTKKSKNNPTQFMKQSARSKQCKNPRVCGDFVMDMKALECPCCGYPMPNLN